VIPLAQVAENVPATEFKVWLVTCHEKPAQLLAAAIPLSGEDHVPSIEGSVGVGVLAEEAVLGASIDEFCSTPAHALVAAAASNKLKARSRCMCSNNQARVRISDAHPCNGHYEKTTSQRQTCD